MYSCHHYVVLEFDPMHNKDRAPLVADPPSLNQVLSAIHVNDLKFEKDILAGQLAMRLS